MDNWLAVNWDSARYEGKRATELESQRKSHKPIIIDTRNISRFLPFTNKVFVNDVENVCLPATAFRLPLNQVIQRIRGEHEKNICMHFDVGFIRVYWVLEFSSRGEYASRR